MNWEMIFSFASNVFVIMGLAVVYSIFPEDKKVSTVYRKIVMGIIVVLLGVTVMGTSYNYGQGIFYDARSVIISVSGMFLGFIPTIIGIVGLSITRGIFGGVGTLAGILSIVSSGAVGLLWRYYRLKNPNLLKLRISWIELYIVSLLVSLMVILSQFVLPSSVRGNVVMDVALALLVVYPIGSLLISMFMMAQRSRYFQSIKTKQSEIQYRDLFNKNNSILFLIDPVTLRIVDVNEEAINTYGYSREEFTSMTVSDINVLDEDEVQLVMNQTVASGKEYFRFQHYKKNKDVINVEVHTGTIELDGITYVYSTVIDISELVVHEQRIRDLNQRFKTMLLSVGDGVIVLDNDGIVTLANAVAIGLLGLRRTPYGQDVRTVFRIYSDETDVSFNDILKQVTITNEAYRNQHAYVLMNNATDEGTHVDFTLSPVTDSNKSVTGSILSVRDITVQKEQQDKIQYISQHDYLTKLYNRYFFEEELRRLDTPRQYPLAIILGDVNGLKLLNDAFGHLEGDKLLIEVGSILKQATRHEDVVARWGGDEFAILLPKTTEANAMIVYDRIKKLCQHSSYELINPSLSLGVALKSNEQQDIFSVIKLAEERMYRDKLQEGKSIRNSLLSTLESTLREKSNETEQHASNMINISIRFAKALKLNQDDTNSLTLLARLHDIGKIVVSDAILKKTSSLSEDDWNQIKLHPEAGARIVQNIPELTQISDGIFSHHEHYNGNGYPRGLKGDDIPLISRMISIVDAYEVMCNGRVYRPSVTHEEAILELKRCSGTQFDPNLIPVFEKLFD